MISKNNFVFGYYIFVAIFFLTLDHQRKLYQVNHQNIKLIYVRLSYFIDL